MGLIQIPQTFGQFAPGRKAVAAVEFAMIAPALIVLTVGIFEMSLRFRASEEATRYVHQVADLVSREDDLTTSDVTDLFNASVYMMKPVDTTDSLDLHVRSIGFASEESDPPYLLWERTKGTPISVDLKTAKGLGKNGESVIYVGVRFHYVSPITSMFGGEEMAIQRSVMVRPRTSRLISIDGHQSEA